MPKNDSDHFPSEEEMHNMPKYNPGLPPLSGHILDLFRTTNPRMTLRGIAARSRASRSTIRKRIHELIRAGLMRKHGKGKATWYTL